MKEVARSVKHNFPLGSPSGPFRINCVTSNCCSGQCVLLTMSITVCVWSHDSQGLTVNLPPSP